jgi:histidinol-phosphate/aromatic aminotransferase/cobyric acid decarboxylase-like protein
MKIGAVLAHLHELETHIAAELRAAAERHRQEQDVYHQCQTFALTVDKRIQKLQAFTERYGGQAEWKTAVGEGSDDLLEDLRSLYLRAQEAATTWLMVSQAAKAARDEEVVTVATECHSEIDAQAKWFTTRIKTGAPQALVVA